MFNYLFTTPADAGTSTTSQAISDGWWPLIQCGYKNSQGQELPNCDFQEFLKTISRIIHFILFTLSVPIAAIMFAYAGFLYITSGANPGEREKASSIFINVAIGLIIALAAWLIISTILGAFNITAGSPYSWLGNINQ